MSAFQFEMLHFHNYFQNSICLMCRTYHNTRGIQCTVITDIAYTVTAQIKAVGDSPYGDGVNQMYIDDLEMYINGVKQDGYSYSAGVVDFIDENTINLSYLIELDTNNDVEDANFKINFKIEEYDLSNAIGEKHSFDFNIKSIDDSIKSITLDEKDGDYILKKVDVTYTYIEFKMELPFQPSLANTHDNFIIVYDDKGRALNMSTGIEGKNKIYTQINELVDIGQITKYIDILVCKNYGEESNTLYRFRVNLE